MNNYIGEFKKFINRGNVVDMSVGVIVGSAFTAIVTAMSNNILKPIVNFFLIALVLFTIVKVINKVRTEQKEFAEKVAEHTLDRKERKELKEHGIKIRDKAAVEAYFAEKKRLADEAAAKAKAEEEEKARIEREKNPTAEDLLKKILEVISK